MGLFDGKRVMWKLEEAIPFARMVSLAIQKVGYDVGLAGSVLKIGESRHDLDLLIFPLNSTKLDDWALRHALEICGGRCLYSKDKVQARWRSKGSSDEKHVEVWRFGRKRVDLIFLECSP